MKCVLDNGALAFMSSLLYITNIFHKQSLLCPIQIKHNSTSVTRWCDHDKGLQGEYKGNKCNLCYRWCSKSNYLSVFTFTCGWMDVIWSALSAPHVNILKLNKEKHFLFPHILITWGPERKCADRKQSVFRLRVNQVATHMTATTACGTSTSTFICAIWANWLQTKQPTVQLFPAWDSTVWRQGRGSIQKDLQQSKTVQKRWSNDKITILFSKDSEITFFIYKWMSPPSLSYWDFIIATFYYNNILEK